MDKDNLILKETHSFDSYCGTRVKKIAQAEESFIRAETTAKEAFAAAEAKAQETLDAETGFWGGAKGWKWMMERSPITLENVFRENVLRVFGTIPEELEEVIMNHFHPGAQALRDDHPSLAAIYKPKPLVHGSSGTNGITTNGTTPPVDFTDFDPAPDTGGPNLGDHKGFDNPHYDHRYF